MSWYMAAPAGVVMGEKADGQLCALVRGPAQPQWGLEAAFCPRMHELGFE